MHELSITQYIVETICERANLQQVIRVKLEIGKLSAVMPDAIQFFFPLCAEGTILEGARLEIDEVEGRGRCNLCESQQTLASLLEICQCGCTEFVCESGQELNIKEIEVL